MACSDWTKAEKRDIQLVSGQQKKCNNTKANVIMVKSCPAAFDDIYDYSASHHQMETRVNHNYAL